jgi:tRNA (mo5U34)-methyltransferase
MTLSEQAHAIEWWHTGIDLGEGVITRGRSNPRMNLLPFLGLADDLTGKTVLDICTWDGFMAFECEERGATVTAVDSFAWDKSNAELTKHKTGRDGFDLARKVKKSKVKPIHCDVLDLSVKKLGTFDIVLFLGVLYHMRHPLLALEKVAPLVGDLLIVETFVDRRDADTPTMFFYPGNELNSDETNWWGPNRACVEAMLHSVGFGQVYVLPAAGTRAVFLARRGAA